MWDGSSEAAVKSLASLDKMGPRSPSVSGSRNEPEGGSGGAHL